MTDKQQSDALRLVALLDAEEWPGSMTVVSYARECVAELLRQHGELETLRTGYAAARLEIESLKAQLHAAKQINTAQFGLLTSSIPGSALRASHWQAPSGATEEVENLRKALVYAAFALHDTPRYMLAQGITLIDGDTVRVSRDGWTVEASVNPHRQPAPATQQVGEVRRAELVPGVMHCAKCKFQLNRVTLCVSDGNAYAGNNKTEPCPNGCGPLWPVTWEQEAKNCWKALEEMHERLMAAAAPQSSPTAQAAECVLEDAAQESEYRRGYRHGYEQRDAEVRGALA